MTLLAFGLALVWSAVIVAAFWIKALRAIEEID